MDTSSLQANTVCMNRKSFPSVLLLQAGRLPRLLLSPPLVSWRQWPSQLVSSIRKGLRLHGLHNQISGYGPPTVVGFGPPVLHSVTTRRELHTTGGSAAKQTPQRLLDCRIGRPMSPVREASPIRGKAAPHLCC